MAVKYKIEYYCTVSHRDYTTTIFAENMTPQQAVDKARIMGGEETMRIKAVTKVTYEPQDGWK